jgi:hypothetical protein
MQKVAVEYGIGHVVVGKCTRKKLKMTSFILLGRQMKNIYVYIYIYIMGRTQVKTECECQVFNESLL